MADEVKQDKINEELQTSSETGALTIVNADDLNRESLELINQLIAEQDIERTKDLTHLFNINQNKLLRWLKKSKEFSLKTEKSNDE